MRRFFQRGLFSFFTLMLIDVNAHACLNDREVERIEREFKSQYQANPVPKDVSPEPASPKAPLILSWAGGALLFGAAVVCLKATKQ